MSSTDEAMRDTYATSATSAVPATKLDAASLGPAFGGWGMAPQPQLEEQNAPDYLFPENFDVAYRRSWGERLTFHIGAAYLAGAQSARALAVHATAGWRRERV